MMLTLLSSHQHPGGLKPLAETLSLSLSLSLELKTRSGAGRGLKLEDGAQEVKAVPDAGDGAG